MLLELATAYVPAQPEIDADLNEYGTLGTKTRAVFGDAACKVGDPDYDDHADVETSAVDTIANILHFVNEYTSTRNIDRVLQAAREHYEAEVRGE